MHVRCAAREDPTAAVITATVGIADADGIVQLGRIAYTRPDLAEAAIDALKDIDDPRTAAILVAIPGLCQQGRRWLTRRWPFEDVGSAA